MRRKAHFGHFLVCMLILVFSAFCFYLWDLERAKNEYIVVNGIPYDYHPAVKGIFIDDAAYYTKPILSFNQIGKYFPQVLWRTVCFLLIYPIVGRLLVLISQGLTFLFDYLAKDLNLQINTIPVKLHDWSPEAVLYGAVLVPLNLFIIPILIIANILIFIYRYLI